MSVISILKKVRVYVEGCWEWILHVDGILIGAAEVIYSAILA
jgi:hypothetical protein